MTTEITGEERRHPLASLFSRTCVHSTCPGVSDSGVLVAREFSVSLSAKCFEIK